MSNPVAVHWFDSTMAGVPALSGTAGTLINVLDACLIDGFNLVTLASVVVASGVATATLTGHGFLDHTVVLIAGATPSGLNGEQRIARIDANTFTWDATGISDQTATGTITAKMAPVGWSQAYSDTNKAVYARTDLAATAMVLRVDDTPAQYPTLILYESMSTVDAGTGPAPTSGSLYTAKSSTANSTARPWRLIADDRALYLFIDAGSLGSGFRSGLFVGDLNTYVGADAYHAALIAHPTAAVNYHYLFYLASSTGAYLSRPSTQLGGAVSCARYSHGRSGSNLGGAGQAYPAPADNACHAWPVEAWEGTTLARGLMPGLWNPIHTINPPNGTLITDVPQLPGRQLRAHVIGAENACVLVDVTGPWR